jgi:hypothetical protein
MYQIFIETRGKLLDYRFIIKSPLESWWRKHDNLTSFEDPTIIIENLDGIRIYLSDIPSNRKDKVQTIIRYAIVVELNDKNDDVKQQALLNLVSTWLEEVKEESKPSKSKIGNLLDECFSEEEVEKLLRVKQSNNEATLENGLKKFIDKLSKLPNPEIKDEYTHARWYGGIEDDRNRQIWIALVSELLKGEVNGQALFLNLATEDNLDKLVSKSKKIGLLINNDSKPNPLPSNNFNIGNIINSIGNSIKNSPLKSFGFGCVLVGLFIFSVPIIFPINRLSESEVINFVVASCPPAITAINPALISQKTENQSTNLTPTTNSPKPENQSTDLTPTPNLPKPEIQSTDLTPTKNSSKPEIQPTDSNPNPTSPKPENQSTDLTPTTNLPKPENQSTDLTPTKNSSKPENQLTDSTPTKNSSKPENQVIKEKLATIEELANKLGVSKDSVLSEVQKCHESFKKWSQKFGKGTWDFTINGSQLTFRKVNL